MRAPAPKSGWFCFFRQSPVLRARVTLNASVRSAAPSDGIIKGEKAAELPPPPAKPAQSANPLRTVDSFGRSVRRSIAQLKELDLSTDVDKDTARKKLDTCLENLEELRRTVETLKMVLDD